MTSAAQEVLGIVVVIGAIYILAVFSNRPRKPKPKPSVAELVADARIEAALLDGWETETRNHLAPLTNTEVNRRLGVAMDTACRDFRDELDRWETA